MRIIFIVVFLLLSAYGIIYYKTEKRMNFSYKIAGHDLPVFTDKNSIAEGKRLYISRGCADCHGQNLMGEQFLDDPAIGTFKGADLTRPLDKMEFEKAVRHGLHKTGRPLIFMPSTDFAGMSDNELGKILAYIRSVPAGNGPAIMQRVGVLARILSTVDKMPLLISAELIDHNQKAPVAVTPAPEKSFGKYIAEGCTGCHGKYLKGGPIPGGPPDWPEAQDISPTAMKKWTEADFFRAIRTGKRSDGTEMKYPMPWKNLSLMTETEIKALWLFLRN